MPFPLPLPGLLGSAEVAGIGAVVRLVTWLGGDGAGAGVAAGGASTGAASGQPGRGMGDPETRPAVSMTNPMMNTTPRPLPSTMATRLRRPVWSTNTGFFIEGGAVAFPVDEVTIAGNARDVLRALDRVGADADTRGAVRAPSLRVAQMAVGGR